MPTFREYNHTVPQGADWVPLDLLTLADNTAILHSDVADIDIRVFEREGARTAVYTSLNVSPGNGTTGPIRNTPVLDGRWNQGPPGYNSIHTITAAAREAALFVEKPGRTYRVEIITNTGSVGGRLISVHNYTILGVQSLPE